MVQVLPPKPNAGLSMAQGIREGFQSTFNPAVQQEFQRGKLQEALGKLKEQSQNPNATPQDLLYNLIEASNYSPEIGRNLPQLYSELNKAREANAMKNVNYGGQQQIQSGGITRPTQQENPQVQNAIRENKFFPKNLGSQQAPGNLPQQATTGKVREVLSGDQLLQKTQQRQAELGKNGIVKSFEDVYNQVSNENEQNRVFNQNVEKDTQNRIASQEKYGELAESRLKKLLPNASDEESAVFKKIGEDAAGQNTSQADIDRFISREVSKYKNTLSNIEKNLEAPRIQNKIQRTFLGKGSDIKSVEQDAKAAIKPLLDLGLNEKARTVLGNAGFYPEERERIIFGELPKDIREISSSIPKASFNKTESVPVSGMAGIQAGNKNFNKEYDLKSQINLFQNIYIKI